ncbi:MAG: type III pantothenate kinase [Ignavibacteria bacterium]
MLLAIDTGNTHTTFGIYQDDQLKFTFRLSTKAVHDKEVFSDFLKCTLQSLNVSLLDITECGISSVVPSVDKNLEIVVQDLFKIEPFFITPSIQLPFNLLIDNPAEVGSDRICNVAGGFSKYGGPLAIVSFGTATVYDIVSKDGNFLGGIIAPGIQTSAKALYQAAEKLPEVELIFPEKVIGTNTITNMQSGIMFGALDAFEGMINRIKEELNSDVKIIITGGFSKLIYEKTKLKVNLEFDLVLEGIKILIERQKKI